MIGSISIIGPSDDVGRYAAPDERVVSVVVVAQDGTHLGTLTTTADEAVWITLALDAADVTLGDAPRREVQR